MFINRVVDRGTSAMTAALHNTCVERGIPSPLLWLFELTWIYEPSPHEADSTRGTIPRNNDSSPKEPARDWLLRSIVVPVLSPRPYTCGSASPLFGKLTAKRVLHSISSTLSMQHCAKLTSSLSFHIQIGFAQILSMCQNCDDIEVEDLDIPSAKGNISQSATERLLSSITKREWNRLASKKRAPLNIETIGDIDLKTLGRLKREQIQKL